MSERCRLSLKAELDSLEKIGAFVARCCNQNGVLRAEVVSDLQLAVDEACSNIIEHGYRGMDSGEISLLLEFAADHIRVEIRDQGRGFDPGRVPHPNIHAPLEERSPGGLGWFLIQQLMDQVEYRRSASGNLLTFVRHLDT